MQEQTMREQATQAHATQVTEIQEQMKQLDQHLTDYVRPATFPLAVRVLKKDEPLPPRAKRPHRDLGVKLSICQGVTMARTYGWAIALGGADVSCPIAKAVFHFEEPVDYYTDGHLACGMYTETIEAGVKTEKAVPKFAKDESGIIAIAPLSRTTFEPDLVIVYGNSAQVMRMVAAALYKKGGALTSTFSARADCADMIIKTKQSNEPQVILPCYGDRVFGQTQDHEMAFTLPYGHVDDFLVGLQGTHRGGVRYPIPQFLQYEANYPATYKKLNDLWEQKTEE